MMNYFSKKKKWMACLILMAFVFSCIMPTNPGIGKVAYAEETDSNMITIPFTKNWENDTAADRPNEIKVTLKQNGEVYKVAAVTAEDNWQYNFNVPLFDAKGDVYSYTVAEDAVEGYKETAHVDPVVNVTSEEKFAVSEWDVTRNCNKLEYAPFTNTETDKTVVVVKKGHDYTIWSVDELSADSKEAIIDSISKAVGGFQSIDNENNKNRELTFVYGMNAGHLGMSFDTDSITFSDKSDWSFFATATYGWSNVITIDITGASITNSCNPEKTEATVQKVWDDNNNQDGKRPASLKVTLSDGTEATLNEGNSWTATVTDLPKYANGQEIEYTWTENTMPAGYSLTGTNKEGTVTTITNSYDPEKTSATVKKLWDDNDNQDGKRPASLKVTLSDGTEVTLNAENNWTATVTNLPKYANGQEVEYTWTEGAMPAGYTLTNVAKTGTVTTLTNSYNPEKTSATVQKVWNDNNNQDGKRPASLTVTLSNGTEVTLNEKNDWTATVENLPKYTNSQEIEYTWTEGNMPEGYTLTDTSVNGTVTTLTNSYVSEVNDVVVTKIWDDNNNPERPGSIEVVLYANGNEVTVEPDVNKYENTWTYTWNDLPKYADGKAIVYTTDEVKVPEGYTSTVDGLTITNTHEAVKVVTIKGSKVWNDNNNELKKRPESITVNLLCNGEEMKEATVTADTNWTYSFENLPKADKETGKVYVYTVTENEVPEYKSVVVKTAAGFDIYNTLITAKAGEVEVGKLVTGDKAPENGVYKFVLNVNATRPVWTALEVYQKQQLEKAYEAAQAVYDAAVTAWEKAIIAFKGNARVLNTTGSAIQFAVADKVTSPSCYEYLMISESGQPTSTTSSSYDFAGYDAGNADENIVTPLANAIRELAASVSYANSAFFKALLGKTAAPLGFMRDDAQNLLDKANELAEAEALVTATDDAVKAFKPEGAKDAEFTLFINGEKYVTTSGTYQYTFELTGAKSMEDVKKLKFRFETTTGSVITYSIDEVDWAKDGYKGTSILNGENKISGLTTGDYELGDNGYSFVFINEYEAKEQQQGGSTYTPPYTSSTNPPKEPEETFEDNEVPLGEAEIPEEPVILPGEELEDPEVPLGDAPRTGDAADAVPFMAMLLAAIAGLAATRRKFN